MTMTDKDAKKSFDHNVALCKILGGDLRTRCLGRGMTEQQFDTLFTQHQLMSKFIDKHDSEGNLKNEQGS